MNHVNLIGKVHSEEVHLTIIKKKSVAQFKMELTESYIGENDEVVTTRTRVPVRIYGRWLRYVEELKKGQEIAVEGKLINEDKKLIVLVNDLIIL